MATIRRALPSIHLKGNLHPAKNEVLTQLGKVTTNSNSQLSGRASFGTIKQFTAEMPLDKQRSAAHNTQSFTQLQFPSLWPWQQMIWTLNFATQAKAQGHWHFKEIILMHKEFILSTEYFFTRFDASGQIPPRRC